MSGVEMMEELGYTNVDNFYFVKQHTTYANTVSIGERHVVVSYESLSGCDAVSLEPAVIHAIHEALKEKGL